MEKTGNQYPPPQYLEMGGGGGSGYLYLHYWPPVDREPAINVDMVNAFLGPQYCMYSPPPLKFRFCSPVPMKYIW